MKRVAITGAVLAMFALAVLISADSLSINFERSQGYLPGSIDNQNGWGGQNPPDIPINPAIDQEIVTNGVSAPPSFGPQSWRISNAVKTLTMIGTGLDSGLPVGFTMVAVDYGGVTPAVYALTLTSGRTFAGTLVNGGLLIH